MMASASYSQHFGMKSTCNEPSSFLYISCCNKCATVLGTVLYCCGMQTLAVGCSLHSSAHTSLLLQCLSVLEGFNQVQMHLKVYCTFFFLAFQSEKAQYTVCMSSKNTNTLKEERPHFLSKSCQVVIFDLKCLFKFQLEILLASRSFLTTSVILTTSVVRGKEGGCVCVENVVNPNIMKL